MSVMDSERKWVDRAPLILVVGAVCLVLVSIAASQCLLFAAIVTALWDKRSRRRLAGLRPSVFLPLILFLAWTVITALAARDVARGLLETKKFFLYSILALVPATLESQREPFRIYRLLFLVSMGAASAGLVQFAMNPTLDLQHRISGFMSHWMTYSGLLMLMLVALSAYAVSRNKRPEWWAFIIAGVLVAGMYLSETRNAWLGSVAGLTTVFLLKRPRAIITMLALLIAFFLVSPDSVKQRLRSGWDLTDSETHKRIELLQTALRMIRDNPWMGVGPKNVNREALRYRSGPQFEDSLYQHMHNDFLQMAVERGLTGLLLWLWLMLRMAFDAHKVFRDAHRDDKPGDDGRVEAATMVSTAALGAWTALLVAGMFEYNFGDSEVLTLFLFIMGLPYLYLGQIPATANSEAPLWQPANMTVPPKRLV